MFKKAMILILFLFFGVLSASSVYGFQFNCPQNSLRVALALNITSGEFAVSEGDYELVDYLTQRVISSATKTGTWIVAPKGSQNIQIYNNNQPVQGQVSSLLLLRQKDPNGLNVFSFKNRQYRGDLLVENFNGQLNMINVIDVEQYLYGVIGDEMGFVAHQEAYKAQAVVSRTYAMYCKNHPQLNYDLGTTQSWQVYGGYTSEIRGGEEVKRAVDATRGQVIYYDNTLIQAFFHSNSGGCTEGAENVWSNTLPYLRPVPTPEDSYAVQVSQNGEWPAVCYQWEKSFTKQELENTIKEWNARNPQERINIGRILSLSASRQAVDPATKQYLPQQTASGRVTQLDFIGTGGVKSFYRDNIRSVLGLRSTLFELYFDSTVYLWNAFNSRDTVNEASNIMGINVDGLVSKLNGNNDKYYVATAEGVKTVPKSFSAVTIQGRGYGHGLGMSQWGALGMAAKGVDYRSIIEHFYNQGYHDGRLTVKAYQPAQQF